MSKSVEWVDRDLPIQPPRMCIWRDRMLPPSAPKPTAIGNFPIGTHFRTLPYPKDVPTTEGIIGGTVLTVDSCAVKVTVKRQGGKISTEFWSHAAPVFFSPEPIIQPHAVSEDGSPAPRVGTPRINLFGFPVTAVLRWMGKEDWSFAEARKAMDGHDVTVADATIHAQLRAGRKGERGDPAKLEKKHMEALNSCLEDE